MESPLFISFIMFIIFLLFGVPISYTLGMAGLAYLLINGEAVYFTMLPRRIFGATNVFVLSAVPFFILAGYIMNASGMAKKLVTFANLLVGRFRGGLAQVNVLASIFFAGLTGSAIADTVAIGSLLIPTMREEGYDAQFSAAVTAGSSIIGPIIPPSCIMVIYGGIMGVSIAGLFAAGIIPGLLVGIGEMIYVSIISKRRNYPFHKLKITRKKIIDTTRDSAICLILPIVIMGSIVFGIATPTEASAVAVAYALLVSLFIFRSLKIKELLPLFVKAVKTSAQLLFLIGCASVYAWILAIEGIPEIISSLILNLTDFPQFILIIMSVVALFFGSWMEITAAFLLLAPIFGPIALETGLHPFQIGITLVIAFLIGIDTPPVGICLFAASGIAEIPFEKVVKEVMPFVLICIIVLSLVIFFPPLTLFVPRVLGLL